jgi:chemotaxis protein methyltransferase CheR
MELDMAAQDLWRRLSERIAAAMGLNFPPERWPDLRRGLERAAKELGLADVPACAEWLLSAEPTKAQLCLVASHLTVGETYFFRDRKTFDALAERILPGIIAAKRNQDRRLRLWSAGCCTGEEHYSLAILLSRLIPDLAAWSVSILATDINEKFLQKAAGGIYGDWSFREAPAEWLDEYFHRLPDRRRAVLPGIKQRVHFANLNLAEDAFPAMATDTNAMDIIFCRNVLMYFTPRQAERVAANLARALVADGWLVVSPSEASQTLFSEFRTVNYPGAILYQKASARARAREKPSPPVYAPVWTPPAVPEILATPLPPVVAAAEASPPSSPVARGNMTKLAGRLYEQGHYEETVDTLLFSDAPPASADDFSLLARALANQGKLVEALEWCDRWLAADKLDASAYYLRAVTLQEIGRLDDARRDLQRAIYLQPDLVLAHFALGNLARGGGHAAESAKHFANASRLLRSHPADAPLPHSDGLTAGRLAEIVNSVLATEAVS